MESQFGKEIDDILAKDGRDWTKEEVAKIDELIAGKHRAALKAVRKNIRSVGNSTNDK